MSFVEDKTMIINRMDNTFTDVRMPVLKHNRQSTHYLLSQFRHCVPILSILSDESIRVQNLICVSEEIFV